MLRKNKQATSASALRTDLKNTDLVANIILQNIEDGVILIDAEQKILTFNLGASQMTGVTIEQALRLTWSDVLKFVDQHSVSINDDKNPIKQAFSKRKSIRQDDAFILSTSKNRVPLHLVASPLINPEGEVEGIIIVMRNMSSEKEQEEAKTDFVSTASHEMRTPLAALEGHLALILSDEDLHPQTLEHARKAHQNVLHLGKLFKNLLTTSQSEDGRLSHHPQVFLLNDLLKQIILENQKHADFKKISLKIAFDPRQSSKNKYYLNADPQRIQELLNNILDNAIKYTDPSGQINIHLKKVNGFVQIKIEDSGYGISPKDAPHLFQKFYRVGNSQPGTGLGLFICKKIVELYKGDIWLESEVGRGSVFYVNLPTHHPKAE